MTKKLMLSILFCFLITTNIFIWYFVSSYYKEKSTVNENIKVDKEEMVDSQSVSEEDVGSFETNSVQEVTKTEEEKVDVLGEANSNYLYAITDTDIDKAIQEGINSRDYRKDYELYKQHANEELELSFIASIDTPYHKVASYASTTYFKEDYIINTEEAGRVINYEELDFTILFREISGLAYGVKLIQDGKVIMPSSVINDNTNGKFKVVSFNVSEINFDEGAYLKVFSKGNEEQVYDKYFVEFKKFK